MLGLPALWVMPLAHLIDASSLGVWALSENTTTGIAFAVEKGSNEHSEVIRERGRTMGFTPDDANASGGGSWQSRALHGFATDALRVKPKETRTMSQQFIAPKADSALPWGRGGCWRCPALLQPCPAFRACTAGVRPGLAGTLEGPKLHSVADC